MRVRARSISGPAIFLGFLSAFDNAIIANTPTSAGRDLGLTVDTA
jgi:hypothetical protein